jgi:hypothetical protein
MKKIKLFLACTLIAAALPTLGAEDASIVNEKKNHVLAMTFHMFAGAQLLACYQKLPSLHANIEEIWRAEPKAIVPSGLRRDSFLACALKVELMSAQQCGQLIDFFQSLKGKKGEVSRVESDAYVELTRKFVADFKSAGVKEEACVAPKK